MVADFGRRFNDYEIFRHECEEYCKIRFFIFFDITKNIFTGIVVKPVIFSMGKFSGPLPPGSKLGASGLLPAIEIISSRERSG